MHYSIRTIKTAAAAALAAATFLSCGDNNYYYYPNPTAPDSTSRRPADSTAALKPTDHTRTGTISIRATANSPGLRKANAAAAIKPAKITVEISADDIQTVRFSRDADFSYPAVLDTTITVEPGTDRRVKVWAEDAQGRQTHADEEEYQTVDVSTDQTAAVSVRLAPTAGSIYIMVSGLPQAANADSLKAKFTASDGTVIAAGAKLIKTSGSTAHSGSVSLDFIPHGAAGTVYAEIKQSVLGGGGIYAKAEKAIVFDARGDSDIALVFNAASKSLSLEAEMLPNGVTNAVYDFSAKDAETAETGELVVTEILYDFQAYNYIELYNPADAPATFDTLIVSTNSGGAKVANVTVPPKGYFVIGNDAAVFADRAAPLTVTRDVCNLTVRRRDRTVIDRVSFSGAAGNDVGWPQPSAAYARASIELKPGCYTAAANNYGRNWTLSQTPLAAVGFGTPGEGYGD